MTDKTIAPEFDVWNFLLTLAATDIGMTKDEALAACSAGTVALCVRFFDLTKDLPGVETIAQLQLPL